MQAQPTDDPGIEALRGIAALMVVGAHYLPLLTGTPGSWAFTSTGVDLFFVLSGFVFGPYLFEKRLQVLPHVVRRFFRMYPLYIVALCLYAVLKEPASGAWEHFGVHVLMAHTLQSKEIAFFYNAAFWSLPPEVEFYALLPLLGVVSRRLGFAPLLLFAMASHMLLAFWPAPAASEATLRSLASVHAPGLLIEFLLGTLGFAIAQRIRTAKTGRAGWVLFLLGLAALVAAWLVFAHYLAHPTSSTQGIPNWVSGNMGLMAAVGYMLVTAAIANRGHYAPQALTIFFVWAGRLSYGIYLLHSAALTLVERYAPAITGLAAAASALLLTVATAWLAHMLIEGPCREYGRSLSKRIANKRIANQ